MDGGLHLPGVHPRPALHLSMTPSRLEIKQLLQGVLFVSHGPSENHGQIVGRAKSGLDTVDVP